MRRHTLRLVAVLMMVFVAGCGKKRPPAVASAPPPPLTTSDGSRTGASRDGGLDSGPDVRPLTDEGASGSDLELSDASGEGGPLADVRFEYDAASLSDEARATLEKHALWLQTHRDTKVHVEGHCDERGTVEYNLALGEQRARAARDYLVSLGVAAERLSTVSYGKERPLDTGHAEASWVRNRRAHFLVTRR